jgi:type IV secretion system protein VirD4
VTILVHVGGRSLVACLMAHMLYHPQTTFPKTLAALRRGIATPESEMQSLLRGINRTTASPMARDLSSGLMDMKAEKTFSGVYANTFAATEWMSVGAYADAVSGDAMHTSGILDSKTVVFVQLPLRTLLATPAVGRAVMGALFNAMFQADGAGIEDRILFQIDEAAVLHRLKEVLLCHSTARKYCGVVSTCWQSEGQLEEIWGKDGAKTMRDTVSWRSYNAVQDGDVAEKLSRDLGEYGVLAYSEGSNTGKQRPAMAWMGSSSRGNNVNTHEIKRRLIKADEIMRAPADEMYVLSRDFAHPIRCVSAPYFRYSDIAGRMKRSRFVKVAVEYSDG